MAETRSTELVGRQVVGFRDDKIGTIDGLFAESDADQPTWARVKTGILGISSVFVPLQDAEVDDGDVRIFYEKEHVRAAPSADPDGDRISESDAVLLHRHYGLQPVASASAADAEDDIELPREPREANPPGMEEGPESPITQRRRERAKELGVSDE